MACLLREELRKRALSMVQIPNHFQPVIEEYTEGENGEGGAMFSWTNKEKDEGIMISLDLAGNLTSLLIDMNDKNSNAIPLNVAERRERAEQFLLSHYPQALKDLTLYNTKKLTNGYRFYYEQMVMDLPLDDAGCFIDVDAAGSIVEFTYRGVKQTPEIPTKLISKEVLIEHVQNRLDFQLRVTNLYTDIHNVAEDGLRLVYIPEPFMEYQADVLQPTLTIVHQEEDLQRYATVPPPSGTIERKDLSIEDIVGISEGMEVIREVDMGEETGIVWRDRDWETKEQDLSMVGFFQRHSGGTVKAFIAKKTGKVRSFMWFKERSGDLCLSHQACYQKAIDFLQRVIPDYYQYLQLIVRENEEVDGTEMQQSFLFHMCNEHGIPMELGLVTVVVNRKTGQIDHYSGPRFDVEQLSQIPAEPAISKKEVREIFINHLDFKLAWSKNYDSETEPYTLVYQACDRHSRTPIRYIDAMTGAVISDKDK
ncbi:YcdB/YcdC domain-containing protein [Peptococcaceae bacterium 1198_IL3148]